MTARLRMASLRMVRSLCSCDSLLVLFLPLSPPMRRTRRTWLSNVQYKRFWSDMYERFIEFRATAFVIKQVKRLGGIDEYLRVTPNEGLVYQKAIKIKRNQRRMRRIEERNAAIAAMHEAGLLEPDAATPAAREVAPS